MGLRRKPSWAHRIQPWLGSTLLALAGLVLVAAYDSGSFSDTETLQRVAPAGFLGLAGLGMVLRTQGRSRWLFLAGAAAAAAAGRALL